MSAAPRRLDPEDARLIVRAGKTRYAIPAAQVREIVRLPRVTPVPLGPAMLIGLGQVRGETLAILGTDDADVATAGQRRQLLVLEGRDRVGLAIDGVERLDRGDAGRGGRVRKFPLESWIAQAFPIREVAKRANAGPRPSPARARDDRVALLRFAIAGQSFALPVEQIIEVVAVPGSIAALPNADAAVLGTMLWRERTLGLLRLSVLLGFGAATPAASREQRIIVVAIAGHLVGLLVDRFERLQQIAADQFDPVPQMLQHGGSEATIQAICRPGDGSLVSVLAADHLLGEARARSLLIRSGIAARAEAQADTVPLLRFAIGPHRLALPLAMVEQVSRVPEAITPVPGAPAWLTGVTQSGGGTIAVVDQVQRLTGTPCTGARRRLIVVRARGDRVGFLVDAAPGLLHVYRGAMAPAPLPAALAAGIYGEALGLGDHGDTLLLLDPAAMIASAEHDLVHALAQAG